PALDQLFHKCYQAKLLGVHPEFSHETLTIAHLATDGHYPVLIGPLQHDEIDVGEALPSRCLKHGLWLANTAGLPFAVLITPAERYGRSEGVHLEIAVTPGEAGLALSHKFLDEVENRLHQTGSYRGKVISLEATHSYSGKSGSVKVHKLRAVQREGVVLAEKTLGSLELYVHGCIQRRARQRE